MAHHRLIHDNTAAIFSPSVARIAASTARDWSHVDSWLSSKFPNPIPQFERNPDTLKALLALAAVNEAADDQRRLLARADTAALQELDAAAAAKTNESTNESNNERNNKNAAATNVIVNVREDILDAVEQGLAKEGTTALDILARLCSEAGSAYADPSDLARAMVRLQAAIYETDQMKARVEMLERQLRDESESAGRLLGVLQGDEYKQPPEMAKQNLDIQRKIKAMSAQLPDLLDRVANLEAAVGTAHPGMEDVVRDERAYLALLAQRKELEAQIAELKGGSAVPDAY